MNTVNVATIFIVLLIGGLIGVVIGASTQDDVPEMNTICNSFHSETKIVDSWIDGERIPMEITVGVCDDFETRK